MADPFLHEHPDFKPLLDKVATDKKIDDPALVEKDYWLMHVLYGLKANGLSFQLKGGTSLSKGYGIIHRFSEDIDIRIEKFDDEELFCGPNHDKPKHVESRKKFFEKLQRKISIPGILKVDRDTEEDDAVRMRNAGLRLRYSSHYGAVPGLKDGILLEVGFDTTSPHALCNISSWALDFALAQGMKVRDNRATDIPCYRPEYTFVEKLQAITKKFRQYKTEGKQSRNFLRHYYDLHQLLEHSDVQKFIGTKEYHEHKAKRFKSEDQNVPKNDAFKLSDTETRKHFEGEYKKTAALYYQGQIPLAEILARLAKDLDRL